MKQIITVGLARRSYQIVLGENSLLGLPNLIKSTTIGKDACVITTAKIQVLHGKKLNNALRKACASVLTLTIPDSEKSKNARLALELIEKITRFDKKKKLFLIAFGGGVVGDLTGFIAAIYKRGVPYIQVPTTLLAQIDSSIGGKTAIDTSCGKNLVGAFYQPRFIVSDINLLKSLPRCQLLAGLSEAIKYALIKDAGLYVFLKKYHQKILQKNTRALSFLIARCAAIKARVVAADEFDKTGIRMILNFGHTFGHAIETASRFKTSHGEAVSLGIVCACRLSEKLGLLNHKTSSEAIALINKMGMPTAIKKIRGEAIVKALAYDKKFTGKTNRFVLLEKIGKTKIVENVPKYLVNKVINEILK